MSSIVKFTATPDDASAAPALQNGRGGSRVALLRHFDPEEAVIE
ncbi:hypothetical protein [Streptomyces sp. fd1-xmd]|nr:hypothetical protein [Streptomyces sp. fd1-xmd]